MGADFHKPTRVPSDFFEYFEGTTNPHSIVQTAHETADWIVRRIREEPTAGAYDRLYEYVKQHGIGDIAQLWSRSKANTLPGTLWKLYLLQDMIKNSQDFTMQLYRLGLPSYNSIDQVLAAVPEPLKPAAMTNLIDEVLHGVYRDDFRLSLDRAASFCRILAAGAAELADELDEDSATDSTALTLHAARLQEFADGFGISSRKWATGTLN